MDVQGRVKSKQDEVMFWEREVERLEGNLGLALANLANARERLAQAQGRWEERENE